MGGDMNNALIASMSLSAFAVMVWLWPYLKR